MPAVQALLRELEQPGMALLSSAAAQAAGVGPNPDPGGRSAEDAARQAGASVPGLVPAAELPPPAVASVEERARDTQGPGPAPAPAAGPPPLSGLSTEERMRRAAEERCILSRPFQPPLGAVQAMNPRASKAAARGLSSLGCTGRAVIPPYAGAALLYNGEGEGWAESGVFNITPQM